jgi:hypothetical protein
MNIFYYPLDTHFPFDTEGPLPEKQLKPPDINKTT